MSFAVDNGTDTTQISASGDHAQIARIEFNVIGDFRRGDVQLDGVVGLDHWIWITDGASVVRNQEWYALGTQLCLLDLAQLVFGFFGRNTMDGKATLNVVDQTEMFTSFFDGNNVHESSWEVGVGADLAVNLDQTLHHDFGDFTICLERKSKLVMVAIALGLRFISR